MQKMRSRAQKMEDLILGCLFSSEQQKTGQVSLKLYQSSVVDYIFQCLQRISGLDTHDNN